MVFTWLNVLQILVSCLSLILGYYLIQTHRCYALAAYFITLCCHNAFRMLLDVQQWDPSLDFTHALRFFYAPLVYFIVLELLYRDFHYRPRHLLHLIPTFAVVLLPLISPVTGTQLGFLVVISNVAYLAASYRVLFRFQEVVETNRATGIPDSVDWLRRTLNFYLGLILFENLRQFFIPFMPASIMQVSHTFFVVTICICLALLIYRGLRTSSLIPGVDKEEKTITDELKNRQPRLSEQEFPQLAKQLQQTMQQDKPYLNPQISIKELAEELDLPARALSEHINDHYDCNFSEYINRARVEEAQRLMADSQWHERSLLDIGLAAGFNSKTSFNVMFKRITGSTPSAFRRQLQTQTA